MIELDYHIMNNSQPVVQQDNSQSEEPATSLFIAGTSSDSENINPLSTRQNESAEPRLQPEEDEPKPISRWLYGSPSPEMLVRCRKLTEMSKQLKHTTYEN